MLRFTIRDVLWLTVVAALLCGWYLTYADWARLAKAERLRIEVEQRDALLNLSIGWKARFSQAQANRAKSMQAAGN